MADKVIYLREKPASPADERNFKIKYAELLNPAQLAAVTHRDGPLLVVAGAGSGKTRTLIYRVARLDRERRAARRDSAADVHAARGAGDAASRGATGRRSRGRGRGRHVSFIREQRAAAAWRADGPQAQLHDPRSLRHGRRDQPAADADGTGVARAPVPEEEHDCRGDQHGAQQAARARRGNRDRFSASRRASDGNSRAREKLRELQARARACSTTTTCCIGWRSCSSSTRTCGGGCRTAIATS